MVPRHALAARRLAAPRDAGVRGLSAAPVGARRVRRVLAAAGPLRPWLLRPVPRRAEPAHGELVRPLRPYGDRELPAARRDQVQPGVPRHRAVDPWRAQRPSLRGHRLRPGGDPRRQPRRRLLGVPRPMVRPAPRRGAGPYAGSARPAGPVLRDGRWRRAANRRRPPRPRRALAYGRCLAAAGSDAAPAVPAAGKGTRHRAAGRGRRRPAGVRLRPRASGTDDRRADHLGRAGHGGRGVRPDADG